LNCLAITRSGFGLATPEERPIASSEDGSRALGFFNRDSTPQTIAFNKLSFLRFRTRQHVRDLWRQMDWPDIGDTMKEPFRMTIPAHGVMLYKLTSAE